MHESTSKTSPEQPAMGHLGAELSRLVVQLNEHQESTLALLEEKQRRLQRLDGESLRELEPRQQEAAAQFNQYVRRRRDLLRKAGQSGIRADSLRELALQLPPAEQGQAVPLLQRAATLARRLHQHCLTNWVLGQRALWHTNQVLEILAGGETKATYGQSVPGSRGGTLIDQAV
jgi:flagellar biosynthesis/type III secretory pathway chaperone